MEGHDRKLLRLIKGSPQPELTIAEIARQIGETEAQAHDRVERLVRAGRLRRDGARLVAIDPAVQGASRTRPLP